MHIKALLCVPWKGGLNPVSQRDVYKYSWRMNTNNKFRFCCNWDSIFLYFSNFSFFKYSTHSPPKKKSMGSNWVAAVAISLDPHAQYIILDIPYLRGGHEPAYYHVVSKDQVGPTSVNRLLRGSEKPSHL